VAVGEFASVNPEAWKIVDGKLFLSFSKAGRDRFHSSSAENIKKADEMWTNMTKEN
jgi:hypothetical protein